MFETIHHYLKKYVSGRASRIFLNSQPAFCLVFALFVGSFPPAITRVFSYELVYQYVSYNFMAFGFTIAALTIVFATPNAKFIRHLFEVGEKYKEKGEGPWEDALFIMSWNGFVHFSALVVSLITMSLSFDHGKLDFLYGNPTIIGRIFYSVAAFIQSYAFIQFLMTMLSVYFFCSSYIFKLKADWKKGLEP